MNNRPALPYRFANPFISDTTAKDYQFPPVKYQILNCQGKDILVGRIKIETPTESGHAFILRRYDTGAISLTTMFRAAFPNANDSDEKAEIHWVKENYDLSGNNGSSKDPHTPRLAGTWIDTLLALDLAKKYSLHHIVKMVVDASPDPNATYRRSGKGNTQSTPATDTQPPKTKISYSDVGIADPPIASPPPAVKALPTPSPSSANPPAKRRKEASPSPLKHKVHSFKPPSRSSPPSSALKTAETVPRRSSRVSRSPAPRPPSMVRTPKRIAKKDQAIKTPTSFELPPVDEEAHMIENGVAGTELMEEDFEEQKNLIKELKRQRLEAESSSQHVDDLVLEASEPESASSKKREREVEDVGEPLKFDFKEPEKEDRMIATNRRVSRTKSVAWGVAAFAVGMSAVAFLPSLF